MHPLAIKLLYDVGSNIVDKVFNSKSKKIHKKSNRPTVYMPL